MIITITDNQNDIEKLLNVIKEYKTINNADLHIKCYDNTSTLFEELSKKIKEAKQETKELKFYIDRSLFSLPIDKISSINSEGHYLKINTVFGQSFTTRMTFSEAGNQLLSDKRFLKVLRGILVNMDYVKDIKNGTCYLTNGTKVPVNIKKCKYITQTWINYYLNKINA